MPPLTTGQPYELRKYPRGTLYESPVSPRAQNYFVRTGPAALAPHCPKSHRHLRSTALTSPQPESAGLSLAPAALLMVQSRQHETSHRHHRHRNPDVPRRRASRSRLRSLFRRRRDERHRRRFPRPSHHSNRGRDNSRGILPPAPRRHQHHLGHRRPAIARNRPPSLHRVHLSRWLPNSCRPLPPRPAPASRNDRRAASPPGSLRRHPGLPGQPPRPPSLHSSTRHAVDTTPDSQRNAHAPLLPPIILPKIPRQHHRHH